MFYSRRGLCGPVSAVMSLELDGAILHISAAAGEVRCRSVVQKVVTPDDGRQAQRLWRSAVVAGGGSGIA